MRTKHKYRLTGLFAIALLSTSLNSGAQSFNEDLVLHIPVEFSQVTDTVDNKSVTNNGAQFTIDRWGRSDNALSFDGINDYLSIPFSGLDLDSFSLSVWVKFDEHPSNGGLWFILNLGGTIQDGGINLANNYSGYTGFSGYSNDGNSPNPNYTTGTLPSNGAWHHIILSRATNSVAVYLDGQLQGTSAATGGAQYSGNPNGFWVGCRHGGSNHFKGEVDDIRIYNRPISSAEVSEIHGLVNSIKDSHITQFNIFPNPSHGSATLESDYQGAAVSVINTLGETIAEYTIDETGNLKLTELNKGVYFVQLRKGDILLTKKLIIQ